ncbi:energy transducer TonB [Fulvimonas sp. R45]|uniref:energy transducer TonB n=1 Tax=Fulvimonas sp. R45 TaxID=3045937 RepID=UPI00265D87FE|nr:energy transducer TonB [Fulvimonas sp. R45]MDO1528469.1 energy transducer TonB [Fulvimonas sp. R45]
MNTQTRRLSLSLLLASAMLCAVPALAQNTRKVGPQQLYNYWIRLNTQVQVNMPNSGKNLLKPGCVAVSYVIGSDGVPMDVKVRKVVPESDLGPAAASAVTNFRFGPSLTNRNHEPVATYYVVPFNAPGDQAARDKLMAPCALPGYDQG